MYYCYAIDMTPECITSRFPKGAQYFDKLVLVGENVEKLTGEPHPTIVDLSGLDAVIPSESTEEAPVTHEQLDASIDALMTLIGTPEAIESEIWMSKPQGRYIYDTRVLPFLENEEI